MQLKYRYTIVNMLGYNTETITLNRVCIYVTNYNDHTESYGSYIVAGFLLYTSKHCMIMRKLVKYTAMLP